MRALHTGDWHIGQTLKSFSREHEHRQVLDQIVSIAREREVDAVIIAGDVFDHPIPSGQSQLMFYETLVRLNSARPGMQIIVTAGNHDNASRLEAPRPLLASLNVHVVGNVLRPGGVLDGERHLIGLKDAHGRVAADVLAVSHPTAACLPVLPRNMGEAQPIEKAVAALYSELNAATTAKRSGAPLIVTGHLHVKGAVETDGSERRILAGGQHAVPIDVFPADAAYVALGHLHKAQMIGKPHIRYCGSILPLSASEHGYAHAVTLLDIEGGDIRSEQITLKRPVAFYRLPDGGEVRLDELGDRLKTLALDASLPIERQPFVQIRLAREGLTADFRAEADRIAQAFPIRLVDVTVTPSPATAEPAAIEFVRLAERAPEDLFRAAFERAHGTPPSARHLEVFHRIAAEA